jgi:hypothetical protein
VRSGAESGPGRDWSDDGGGSASRNAWIRSAIAGQSGPSQAKWLWAWLFDEFGVSDGLANDSVGEWDAAVGAGGVLGRVAVLRSVNP